MTRLKLETATEHEAIETVRFASSREVEDRIIAGARDTFRAFTRWLDR